MGTSSGWLIKISNRQCSKSWAPMSPLPSSPAPPTTSRPSASNYLSWSWSSRTYTHPHSAKEVFHFRSPSLGWQECASPLPGLQLPVHNPCEALHLHYAHEIGLRYCSLNSGWNQIQFNLSDFTRRAYGSNYIETLRVTIHANCRIRRIYFSDRLYSEEELPPEFKLFLPIQKQQWAHHSWNPYCC